MWWLLAMALARADDASIEWGFDAGARLGDAFQRTEHLGLHLAWRPDRALAVELRGSFAPDFGEGNWSPVTRQLVHENRVSPDLSHAGARLFGAAVYTPASGEIRLGPQRALPLDLRVAVGMGVVYTYDDPGHADGAWSTTDSEWLPTLIYGLGARFELSERVALRFDAVNEHYVEARYGVWLETTRVQLLSTGMSFAVGPAR